MNDYLGYLAARSLNQTGAIQPRLASVFEPFSPTDVPESTDLLLDKSAESVESAGEAALTPVANKEGTPSLTETSHDPALFSAMDSMDWFKRKSVDRSPARLGKPLSGIRHLAKETEVKSPAPVQRLSFRPLPSVPREATTLRSILAFQPATGPSTEHVTPQGVEVAQPASASKPSQQSLPKGATASERSTIAAASALEAESQGSTERTAHSVVPEPHQTARGKQAPGIFEDGGWSLFSVEPSQPIPNQPMSRANTIQPHIEPQLASDGLNTTASAPTIRVTIGRIEVRAIQPPASSSAPRPARTRRPTLSLSEYLKQRDGGRR